MHKKLKMGGDTRLDIPAIERQHSPQRLTAIDEGVKKKHEYIIGPKLGAQFEIMKLKYEKENLKYQLEREKKEKIAMEKEMLMSKLEGVTLLREYPLSQISQYAQLTKEFQLVPWEEYSEFLSTDDEILSQSYGSRPQAEPKSLPRTDMPTQKIQVTTVPEIAITIFASASLGASLSCYLLTSLKALSLLGVAASFSVLAPAIISLYQARKHRYKTRVL